MAVLIVGSIAYDSVRSPEGSIDRALGGSATYGGLSCRFVQNLSKDGTTGLVGVVGEDFAERCRFRSGRGRNVSLGGVLPRRHGRSRDAGDAS